MAKLRSVLNTSVIALAFGASLFLAPALAIGRFQGFNASDSSRTRMNEVAKTVSMDKWPHSDLLRLAPPITKDMLMDPAAVTSEWVDYSTSRFKDNTAVSARWTWDCHVQNPEMPTELPKTYVDLFLKNLTEKQRNDPNFVKERLKEALERYQKSKERIRVGNLRVDICRAPDANTAQEFLISLASLTPLPTGLVTSHFSNEARMEGLGNVAFNRGWLTFVRDNIAVAIKADGRMEQETVPLAKKIDALIQKQPVLTKEQLQSSQPLVTIAALGRKVPPVSGPGSRLKTVPHGHLVDYSVSVPPGQEIASLAAFVIDAKGKARTEIVDGKIRVVSSDPSVKIRIEVITTGLLATAVERDVTLPNDPVPNTPESNSRQER
jgi:hypothetical protein